MLRLAGERADGTVLWMTGPATVRRSHRAHHHRGRRCGGAPLATRWCASCGGCDGRRGDRPRPRREGVPDLRNAAVLPGDDGPRRRRRPRRPGHHRKRGHGQCPAGGTLGGRRHRIRGGRVHTARRPDPNLPEVSTYVLLGLDAARAPGARVDQAAATLAALRKVVPMQVDDELIVRGNGAVQAVGGALLVTDAVPVGRVGARRVDDPDHGRRPRLLEGRRPGRPQAAADPVPQEHGHDRRPAVRGHRPRLNVYRNRRRGGLRG